MNTEEARELGRQIVRQSDCVIKFGRTNGRNCIYVRLPGGGSETIYSAAEWTYHHWNKSLSKKEREPELELMITEVT